MALLDLGADRDQRTHGYGAVHFAMMSGHTAAFQVLVEQGHPQCVRLLVTAGAPVDVADGEGRTPLDWARNNHFTACVDALTAPS